MDEVTVWIRMERKVDAGRRQSGTLQRTDAIIEYKSLSFAFSYPIISSRREKGPGEPWIPLGALDLPHIYTALHGRFASSRQACLLSRARASSSPAQRPRRSCSPRATGGRPGAASKPPRHQGDKRVSWRFL